MSRMLVATKADHHDRMPVKERFCVFFLCFFWLFCYCMFFFFFLCFFSFFFSFGIHFAEFTLRVALSACAKLLTIPKEFEVIVPQDASLEDEKLRAIGARLLCQRLLMRTTPGWSAVPHINDGRQLLQTLASSAPAVAQPLSRTSGGPGAAQQPPPGVFYPHH
jgi:hypothetical protein